MQTNKVDSNNISFLHLAAHGALDVASVMTGTAGKILNFAGLASPLLFLDGVRGINSVQHPQTSFFNCGSEENRVGCGYALRALAGFDRLTLTQDQSMFATFTQTFVAAPLVLGASLIGARAFTDLSRRIDRLNNSF